jgi:hypothetical protein
LPEGEEYENHRLRNIMSGPNLVETKQKDINVTINPTVSIEEVLELDMEQLKKYNLEKKDIDGKIDYQMILRFKANSTIITKEIIRIPTERLKKQPED